MDTALLGITSDGLLGLTRAHGYEVNKRQLADWHRYGLLPEPERRFLGRGRGSESVYPMGTDEQLLALLEIHSGEKRLDHVAWQLWWRGFPVSLDVVRSFLTELAAEVDSHTPYIADLGSRQLSSWAKSIAEESREAGLDKPVGRSRKRLGRIQFPAFVRVLLRVWGGVYTPGESEFGSDTQLVEQAYGVQIKRRRGLMGPGVWVKSMSLAALLREGSRFLLNHSIREELAALSDEQMLLAREEAAPWLEILGRSGLAFDWIYGRGVYPLSGLSEAVRSMRPSDEGIWFTWWAILRFRGPMLIRKGMERMGRPDPELVMRMRNWDVIERLREQIPGVADILTPRRMRAALDNPDRMEEIQIEIDRFREENAEDLDAFFEAHPEYIVGFQEQDAQEETPATAAAVRGRSR